MSKELEQSRIFNEIQAGDVLPAEVINVTKRMIVGGAIASRDFEPVHHDTAAAQAVGMQDVFMNILCTNGLVGRYVTGWSGPAGRIKDLKIRLGVPNCPGEIMTMTGEVLRTWKEGGENLVELDVKGKNSLGYHVTGKAIIVVPSGESA